ncbi:hypothetical protein BIFPSEUDO_03661 [Bifidobacterium pseudocatenulatum DSM 20438 = JCM 1200 = LMG 10505]|uniref:Uncharacterized protein n=1 Tax=Bifidobacterium pseudocatenulatum DSM 20438 = JCM 1200 = LMG 10505 TaxID=547043 RepID=C0BTD7_BIFPS|nr:hypothetical protein BIFPSEUDO_03661 [Bifidobacterium pseudocatenulatum DSM 20438 = JCM 1200 = LMG 10505]
MEIKGFCHIHRHIRGINEDAEVLAYRNFWPITRILRQARFTRNS